MPISRDRRHIPIRADQPRFRRPFPVASLAAVLVVVLLSVSFAAYCAAAQPVQNNASQAPAAPLRLACGPPAGFSPNWQPVFRGIDQARAQNWMPPVAVYAVRIDLTAPGIEFLVTPSNGDRPRETDGQTASAFLREHTLQVAINASPFSPVDDAEGASRNVLGLSISRGDFYSQPAKEYGALLITRDNRARIVSPPIDTDGVYNAVGGFNTLLEDGKNAGQDDKRHPRTAVGVSKDGRYLYWVVVDGRQPDHSVGATTAETAEWIRSFGAHDALNLDGGGSSTLVMDDGQGEARVVNRPIHGQRPGDERANGNNLGVYAHALQ